MTELGPEPGDTWITHPLGDSRKSPRDFCEAVWFALKVLKVSDAASVSVSSS